MFSGFYVLDLHLNLTELMPLILYVVHSYSTVFTYYCRACFAGNVLFLELTVVPVIIFVPFSSLWRDQNEDESGKVVVDSMSKYVLLILLHNPNIWFIQTFIDIEYLVCCYSVQFDCHTAAKISSNTSLIF